MQNNNEEPMMFRLSMSHISDTEITRSSLMQEETSVSESAESEIEEELTFEQAFINLNKPGAHPIQEVGDYDVFKRLVPGEKKPQYYAINIGKNGVANNDGKFGVLLKTYRLDPTLGNNQNLEGPPPFVAKKPKDREALDLAKNENKLTPTVIKESFEANIDGIPHLIMPRFDGMEVFDAAGALAYNMKRRKDISFINRLLVATELFEQLCQKCHFPIGGKELNPIVHKDIKPENVMIATHLLNLTLEQARIEYQTETKKKRALIIDYGLAAEVTRDARTDPRKNTTLVAESSEKKVGHVISGSPHYVSPELRLRSELSLNSDMYSLAAVMLLIFGSTNMPDLKTDLSHKNISSVIEEKAFLSKVIKKMNACGVKMLFYKGLPSAIEQANEYVNKFNTTTLPPVDPLYHRLLSKHFAATAPDTKPESIKTFCQMLSLGRFKYDPLKNKPQLESSIRKGFRNAMSIIHKNWLHKNNTELTIKTANTGFGDKNLFKHMHVPTLLTEKKAELLASLPDKKERDKYSGTILGVLHFMLNRMHHKDMEKRPSSRQMMHFCQILLSVCLATPTQKILHHEERINQLHELAIDVLHSRETDITELKKDKSLPPSLSLSRATTESPSERSETDSPLGACNNFLSSPSSNSVISFFSSSVSREAQQPNPDSILGRLMSTPKTSPVSDTTKKSPFLLSPKGTLINLEKGSI